MWIKTEGGYLLNTDMIEYIFVDEVTKATYAHCDKLSHMISKGDIVDRIANGLSRDIKLMEVR